MVLTYVDQLSKVLAWSWTLNKSLSLSGVQQTLFLDQSLIQLLSGSNSGLKFECSAPFELSEIFCPRLTTASWHVSEFLSSKFVWQLVWIPYYELEYTVWRKQLNKSHHFWSSFGCSNWISKIEPCTVLSLLGLNVGTLNFSFGYSTLDPCISLTKPNQTWTL